MRTGRSLSTGGDLATFAGLDGGELSARLRQMIDLYHLALDRLTRIDPPVVCAVRAPRPAAAWPAPRR